MNTAADIATEAKRRAHYLHLMSIFPDMVARLYWSREQIEQYRTAALRDLLRHVRAHSPWYANRIGHLDPDTATIEDLASVPPMTKQDLMENWDRIITVPGASLRQAEESLSTMTDQEYLWGDHSLFASGGTGGHRGIFVYDWNALAVNYAGMTRAGISAVLRAPGPYARLRDTIHRAIQEDWGGVSRQAVFTLMRWIGARRSPRAASMAAERSAHGSYVMSRIFSNPASPTRLVSSWRTAAEIAPELNAYQPEVMSVFPSMLPALAQAADDGLLSISPRLVQFVSEACPRENFAMAERLWPKAVLQTAWASSEAGGAFPCPLGDLRYHVSNDLVVIEPIYPEEGPTGPGHPSQGIYLTNLFNYALPIIRYEIDDMFVFDEEPCRCGSAYDTVREVTGRTLHRFRYGDILVHPSAIELSLLKRSDVTACQTRQTEAGVELRYVARREIEVDGVRAEIVAALESYGLRDCVVELTRVTEIEKTAAGKMVRFVPLPA